MRSMRAALVHGLHELVHIPAMLGTDGYGIGDPVKQIQLLDADCVDFIQNVNDGDITSGFRLDHIDQIIDCGVASDGNVCRRHFVLAHHRLDFVMILQYSERFVV